MEKNIEPFALDRSLHYLKHHQYIERIMLVQLAGLIPSIPDWKMKQLIGMHVWQDSIHANEIRARIKELRHPRPDKNINHSLDQIKVCFDSAPSPRALISAIYESLKPQLSFIYDEQVNHIHQVGDAPTVRLLIKVAEEEKDQCHDMMELVAQSFEFDYDQTSWQTWFKTFDTTVRKLLQDVFQIDKDHVEQVSASLRVQLIDKQDGQTYLPSPQASRPSNFRINNAIEPPKNPNRHEEVVWQFTNYVQEMQAAETVGSILYEIDRTPKNSQDMPWEFYFDLARHLWDEVRHSMLGEVRLQELGITLEQIEYMTENYRWRQEIDPVRRYATLTLVIEVGSFPLRKKRLKGHLAKGDFLSAQALLYDETDETMHVQYGKKWVPELMAFKNINVSMEEFVEECQQINDQKTVQPLQRSSNLHN